VNIAKRGLQGFQQLAPLAGIDARGFAINQRFALAGRGVFAGLAQRGDRTCRIAFNHDDRVQQQIDTKALRGNRRRHGIDQKRHIFIDNRDPQMAPFAACGFDLHQRLSRSAIARGGQQIPYRCLKRRLVYGPVARQQRRFQMKAKGIDQRALVRFGRRFGGGFQPHHWLPASCDPASIVCNYIVPDCFNRVAADTRLPPSGASALIACFTPPPWFCRHPDHRSRRTA
jgi:hypothetical protein